MREEERSSQEDPEVSWGLPRVSEAPTSSLVMVSRVEGRDWLLPLTGVKDRRFSLEGDEEKAGGRSREVSAIPFLLLIWVGVEGASSSWEPRGAEERLVGATSGVGGGGWSLRRWEEVGWVVGERVGGKGGRLGVGGGGAEGG